MGEGFFTERSMGEGLLTGRRMSTFPMATPLKKIPLLPLATVYYIDILRKRQP